MDIKGIIVRNKNIIINIIGAFLVRGLSMIVSLLTMPAYISYFQDQTILGLWFTLLSVLNWILMFDLGLGNGLRNKLPYAIAENNHEKAKRYISSTYISAFILTLFLSLLIIIVFPFIPWNKIFNIDATLISHAVLVKSVKIIFIGILIQIFLKLITSVLYAIQKPAIVNFISLLTSVIILIYVKLASSTSLEQSLINMSWANIFAVNIPLLITTIIIFSTVLKESKPSIDMFNFKYSKEILQIGGVLLWLQLVFMIISSTNEFLVSYLTSPASVVEYQIYFKIFNAVSSIFTLALIPIWSAVTKAQAEHNYLWISKLYKLLLFMAGIVFLIELSMVPLLQKLMDFWIGESYIEVKWYYAIIIALSNSLFVLHNVNTSIGNGMSYFKTQIIWMTFAAIVNVPLAILFVNKTGSWIGVIIANIFSLLPYEVQEPIYIKSYIKGKIGNKK